MKLVSRPVPVLCPSRPRRRRGQRGFTIIENLFALVIIAISITGASSLIINAMHGNAAARTYASLIGDVQDRIEDYRQQPFNTLLANFGVARTAITHGQTVTISQSSEHARATYTITFTAVKNNPTGIPQAVRVRIEAEQRRGRFGPATYSFETLIANVG